MTPLEDLYDERTLNYAKRKKEEIKHLDGRLHNGSLENCRNRDPYFRDYARILYSSSFRRLQGKMQLLGVDQTNFYRNRLTHSLEVSQISRGIAERLKLDTTLVAEACSLAHDLGNPPFGHHGERVLNELASDIGGYEGNAQTLRILMRLERKHPEHRGLNLSLRTLLGVIKYDRKRRGSGRYDKIPAKKSVYDEDYDTVHEWLRREGVEDDVVSSIDMQVMDLADEIAYAAHDLEDCLSIGYFTIEELLHEFKVSSDYNAAHELLRDIVDECRRFAGRAGGAESSEEYSVLFRKELTSQIVNALISNIHYRDQGKDPRLDHKDNYKQLATGLKKLIFREVLRKPTVRLYEQRGRKIVEGLFQAYSDKTFNTDLMLLPPEFRIGDGEDERKRSVVDYIGGMMDSYAMQEFQRYFGGNELERLYEYEGDLWRSAD